MGAVSFAKLVQDDPLKRVAMYAYRPISGKVRNSRPMMPGVLPTHFAAGCRGNRAKAGLLTCPTLRAFRPKADSGQCGEQRLLRRRDLQQRELLPICTAFPFNPLINLCFGEPLRDKNAFFFR